MPADPRCVIELFGAAIEMSDPAQRQAFLDRQCAGDAELRQQLELLLHAHAQPNPVLDQPLAALRSLPSEPTGWHAPPERELPVGGVFAGRYKVREKLGQGGMGSVYVADQTEPVARRVALKVIKADVSSARLLARFEQERQALAMMDHPNIARVLDAGISDGTPYFVMELIKGVPITRYCDEAKLNPRQRLDLFIPVCQAVQHAHQKGIIHRDLKPSNILVGLYDGRPVPKVIDFGVAKATGPKLSEHTIYTEVGQIVGTIEYMSPEQAELNNLDIDTRTDVYALGVVLYELLTGTVPFSRKELKAAGFAEMLRIIKEVEPPRPSTRLSGSGSLPSIAASRQTEPAKLTRLLRGDLDWIVMKALEKDRSRRYETANGLAMDVQRYLADEAVLAGPPGAAYRLQKFVARNRPQVLAACLVLLALVGGVVGTTWGLLRAEHSRREAEAARDAEAGQRAEAEQEKRIAQAVRDFLLTKLLGQADVAAQADALLEGGGFTAEANRNVTVRQLLDRAAAELTPEKVETNFPDQPLLQAAILHTVGKTYLGVGEPGPAVAFLQRVEAIQRRHLGPDHPDTLSTRNNLGMAYREVEKLPEALRVLEQVRDARVKTLGAGHPDTLKTLDNLAGTYAAAGRLAEATALFEQVRDAWVKKVAPNHPDALRTLNNLALAYQAAGRVPEAVALLEQVRDARQKLAADHPETLAALSNLAGAYRAAGRSAEAVRLFEQVRDAWVKKLGPDHPNTLRTLNNLALAYRAEGKLSQAFRLLEQARAVCEKKFAPDDHLTLSTLHNLAVVHSLARQLDRSIPLFESVLELRTAKLGRDHHDTLLTMANLAVSYRAAGRLDDALPLLEEAHRKGKSHPQQVQVEEQLRLAYLQAGKTAEALKLMRDRLAAARERLPAGSPLLANLLVGTGQQYLELKQWAEAEAVLREGLTRAEALVGHKQILPWQVAQVRSLLGGALLGRKRYAEAEPHLLAGYQGLKKDELAIPPQARGNLAQAIGRLVELYEASGKKDEAAQWRRKLTGTK